MNPYEELQSAVAALAAEFPTVSVKMRPLSGSRDANDQLIIERAIGDDVRVVRVPAVGHTNLVRGFYWGHLPAPGKPRSAAHTEGHSYGNPAYVLSFIRALLFELQDWRSLHKPPPPWAGSP
jgi:hypothetical protein